MKNFDLQIIEYITNFDPASLKHTSKQGVATPTRASKHV